MRNYFPKRPSDAPLHTLSKLYDVPVGFDPPPYFEAEYCLFCGRRRVAVARYLMICLVLELSVGVGAFVMGLSQFSFFFSLQLHANHNQCNHSSDFPFTFDDVKPGESCK